MFITSKSCTLQRWKFRTLYVWELRFTDNMEQQCKATGMLRHRNDFRLRGMHPVYRSLLAAVL